MTNLIPMAGEGMRFAKEGYSLPKPLIRVSGKPMAILSARSLPPADNWVFVCRAEHMKNSQLKQSLLSGFQNASIITLDSPTEGQASTCLLAENYINPDEPLVIGPCDNSMTWDREKYSALVSMQDTDCVIWTFKNHTPANRNPQMYGWVRTDGCRRALGVSCKTPISGQPAEDHGVVGVFYFRRASMFFDAARSLIENDRRINGEFYVDEAMNELIEGGLGVRVFQVEKYVCWGTPSELKTYQYYEEFFRKSLKKECSHAQTGAF